LNLEPDNTLDKYIEPSWAAVLHKKGEHYDLLSTLSKQYNGVKLYDIGTYKGLSALALSSNQTNLVISYDISYNIIIKQPNNVEFRIGNFYTDKEMLSSPLIMFDIDPHDGLQERNFVDNLINVGYKGTVIFDDIHLNDGMKDFWSSVTQEKHDYTQYGHWSGTGIVIFK
jgi:hypothetical protein